MSWTIRYFLTREGVLPAREFRASLPAKLRSKLDLFVQETARSRGSIGGGIFQACHGGYGDLFKVRAKLGRELARYFCGIDGEMLILLDGIHKRLGEATPDEALDRAAGHLAEYRRTRRAV